MQESHENCKNQEVSRPGVQPLSEKDFDSQERFATFEILFRNKRNPMEREFTDVDGTYACKSAFLDGDLVGLHAYTGKTFQFWADTLQLFTQAFHRLHGRFWK